MGRAERPLPHAERVVACPECDLLQRIGALDFGGRAKCPRCGFILANRPIDSTNRALALTVTAAVVFLIANVTPLMSMAVVGRHATTTIAGGAIAMWLEGQPITGALVMFCAVVAPAFFIMLMLTLLILARRDSLPHWYSEVLRWAVHVEPWAMFEVMLLGILVALIKIAELATVISGIGMFATFALTLLFPAIIVNFDAEEIWHRVEWVDDEVHPEPTAAAP
jgi:paraquat-inducible protein A